MLPGQVPLAADRVALEGLRS
ncbi:MAG: hypothetical protein QOI51_1453, partial [Nocardioidaceae bacterium]|nr:hypothetical protein [Nocardioidaceae bacterium]